jgi:hypothetical protein
MSSQNSSTAFPRIDIPKKDKENEKYHKQFTLAIINNSIHTSYDVNYAAMNESVVFFNGQQGGDEFNFVQSAEDGEVLPAKWITFNRIRSKLEVLFGELQAKGYQINATSINKDAKARKLQAKEESRVNMRMAPDREMLEQSVGMSLAPQGFLPQDEEELDSFYNYTFKEKNEIIMEYALRWLAKKHKWSYTRLAAYRDLMIMGRCFYITEIKDGLPYTRRIDPRFIIFDANATDDFLSDSTFFGEIRYMTVADASSKYGLAEDEIKNLHSQHQQYQRTQTNVVNQSLFMGLEGSSLQYFKGDGNDLRVLVMTGYWQDQEILKHREFTDSYGGEHIKEVSDKATKGKLRSNTVSQWRTATLIGGELVKDWGVLKNSVRDNDAMAETQCPIKGLIPNYFNGQGVSKVDQIKGLQKLKDLAMYNMQLEMTTAGRKGFVYDTSQTPDGWDIHTVMKYLKTAGIAFIDSKKDGLGSSHNQFQKIDQTISEGVNHYINIALLMDSQMDAITGINDARQGEIQGANQAVGVTQAALMQSNMATKMYEDLFRMLNESALNYQAGLVKLSFAGNERYAPIIGDVGVNFLEQTTDLELDDFGVFIEELPPLLQDLTTFREIVTAALNAGQLDFITATKLLIEKDITVGIQRFEAADKQNKIDAQKAQQAAEQAAAQAEAQKFQQEHGSKEAIENIRGEFGVKEQTLDNKGDLDVVITKLKGEAGMKNVDVTRDIALARLKENEQARKDTVIK